MSDYSALVGPGLSYAGPDQGIDFTGAGELYTPYGAVVTRVQPSGSGWPGQGAVVNLMFVEGPAKGRYLYYAEDLVPTVRQGQKVPAGATVARATGVGLAPGVEIGWAQPSGIPVAPRPAPRPAPQTTQQGVAFDRFIQAVSSVKSHGGNTNTSTSIGAFLQSEVSGGAGANLAAGATHIPGVKQAEAVGSFLGKLTDPSYILRGLQILAGAGLVAAGVVLLAKQVALAADLPNPAGKIVPAAAVE